MKLHVNSAKPPIPRMIAIAAVVAPVLAVTAWSGPVVNASTSTTAVAQADATRADATRSPDPVAVREAAMRAEIMRLRALGRLRGTALPALLAPLAAQGTLTGPAPTPITSAVTSGAITGVVRDAHGLPLRGVCVTATSRASQASTAGRASQASTARLAGWADTAFAVTGADGRYALTGLRPGSYALAYRGCAEPVRYVSQWSGGAAWPELATPVSVTAGQVRVAPPATLRPVNPAALLTSQPRPGWVMSTGHVAGAASTASTAHGGRISGVVTGKGKPLKGVCVTVWRLVHNGAFGIGVNTARGGTYSVGRLKHGRYQVEFADDSPGCSTNWLMQWYKGINGFHPFPPFNATTIVLKTGQQVRGIDASLKLGGQISGVVTSTSGKGLGGICVTVQTTQPNGVFGTGSGTDRTGRYAMHGVFPGRYLIGFSTGCGNHANYAPQWWRDSPTAKGATLVHIIGPEIAGQIDARLQPGGVITGVVRAVNASGQPLGGVCVSATNRDGSISVNATTKADGSYRLARLGTARYQVTFDPSCGGSVNSIYLATAKMVTARAGATKAGVNAFLPLGAGVSGTVTNSHGHPLGGMCVLVNGQQAEVGTQTASNGTYVVEGVPAGAYQVQFSGGCGNSGSYAPQFYNDESNAFEADSVTLTTGDITPSIDATMQSGGTITGVVTDRAGHRLGGICVAALGQQAAAGGGFYNATTGNGNFRMTSLEPGAYQVQFFDCNTGRYASQSFRATSNPAAADLVSVGPGVTSGINARLGLAGTISGVVTNQAGHPLSEICVEPLRLPLAAINVVNALITNNKGAYRVTGLTPGSYVVQFSDCGGHPRYGGQWYRGKATLAAATRVRVTAGGTTTGVGAALAVGGSIAGQVRAAGTNAPLADICVLAIDQATQELGFTTTNSAGRYSIPALATGNYKVLFAPCDNQNLVAIARPGVVHVTAPHARTGINVTLAVGGSISGTVLGGSPTATPQAGICVDVASGSNGVFGVAQTAADGTYTVTGLATGSYQILFGDPTCPLNTTFASSWYNDKPSQSAADAVSVTAGTTTSGIGATLLPGGLGAISGTVTGPSSTPVADECVTAFNITAALGPLFSGETPVITTTGADGSYTLGYLLPGTYKVRFDTGCGAPKFGTQWWDNAATRSAATTVTVSANVTTTGISASLHP